MGSIWTALGNRLETAWKRPTKPNSKRPKDGENFQKGCNHPLAKSLRPWPRLWFR